MEELKRINDYFASHYILLSAEWLESCIEWCKKDCLPPNYTEKDLRLKVYEQWLLLDLRQVQVPSLPNGLSDQKKYTLTGSYTLQMMKVVDISRPKYFQLQRIRNKLDKNTEPETDFGKRMLQLTLTDGVQEIEAMEFKPIGFLNINMVPGIKVNLKGPVTIRNGRVMLESHNIVVIGGEVEEIRVENAAENVLATQLGLEMNPNPFVIDESISTANMDILRDNDDNQPNNNRPAVQNIKKNLTHPAENRNTNLNPTVRNASQPVDIKSKTDIVNKSKSSGQQIPSEEFDIDEELLKEFEADFDEPVEKLISKSPDLFEEMASDDDLLNKHVDNLEFHTHNPVQKLAVSSTSKEDYVEDDFGIVEAEMFNLPCSTQIPISPPKTNVISIDKLKKMQPNIGNGKFKIKAKFKSVIEKMSLQTNKYHLVICVADDSGDIVLEVRSDVVSNIAGLSPEDAHSLKQRMIENDESAKTKLLQVLSNLRNRLINLDNIFEVEVTRGEKYPILTNVL